MNFYQLYQKSIFIMLTYIVYYILINHLHIYQKFQYRNESSSKIIFTFTFTSSHLHIYIYIYYLSHSVKSLSLFTRPKESYSIHDIQWKRLEDVSNFWKLRPILTQAQARNVKIITHRERVRWNVPSPTLPPPLLPEEISRQPRLYRRMTNFGN